MFLCFPRRVLVGGKVVLRSLIFCYLSYICVPKVDCQSHHWKCHIPKGFIFCNFSWERVITSWHIASLWPPPGVSVSPPPTYTPAFQYYTFISHPTSVSPGIQQQVLSTWNQLLVPCVHNMQKSIILLNEMPHLQLIIDFVIYHT